MAKRVAARRFVYGCRAHGLFHRPLQEALVHMMPPGGRFSSPGTRSPRRSEKILPREFPRSLRGFSSQCRRQENRPGARLQILLVHQTTLLDLAAQPIDQAHGQHRDSIPPALGIADRDLKITEINILYPVRYCWSRVLR